jgi:hypothetical protein
MKNTIKKIVSALLPQSIIEVITRFYLRLKLHLFGPESFIPHDIQQRKTDLIKDFQERYQYETLVETGTYMGDTVEAQKMNFRHVISVELAPHLASAAKKRFRKDPHVSIIEGDSGKVLHDVVPTLTSPAIFWLDGHYSAGLTAKGESECPIFGELGAILKAHKTPHVILIDDAHDFNGTGDYPTVDALTDFVKKHNPNYTQEIIDNIICYHYS